MKKSNNFSFLLGEGVRAMFKHGFMSFAAICITVACLVIINSFALICYDLNLMVDELQAQTSVLVFVDEGYTEAEAMSVGSEINLIDNVSKAVFVSREQALENFIGDSDRSAYEGLESKTMRDQFIITLKDNNNVKQTISDLEKVKGVSAVYADIELANAMATVRTVLYISAAAIAAVLLIVSLIIISNTIRLAMLDRKEEIAIMKMVGATNGFIRLPFFVEGFLLGLFGAVLSFFIEWGLYEALRQAILKTDLKVLIIVPFTDVIAPMILICGVAGFFIGIFGSLMSIRRFLKV